MYCSQCGNKQIEGTRYCHACGAEIMIPKHDPMDGGKTKDTGFSDGRDRTGNRSSGRKESPIKAVPRPPKPKFPWGGLYLLTIIGLGGAAFMIGASIEAAEDPVPIPGVIATFVVIALIFLVGWIWILSVMIKEYRESVQRYKSSPKGVSQSTYYTAKNKGAAGYSQPAGTTKANHPVYFTDSWDPIFKESDDMAFDYKGKCYLRVGEYEVIDTDTGEMRWITPWSEDLE